MALGVPIIGIKAMSFSPLPAGFGEPVGSAVLLDQPFGFQTPAQGDAGFSGQMAVTTAGMFEGGGSAGHY